ncbi:hypothetical protein SOQ14_09145 [Erythrobacter sp. T5W1-R]|uniref:hypothetical protein n=1 Tax=Erythrobacter sp. T5W1-R TaxID=3101752 RepID=UPI002AFFCF25|nr:hypothetical protein [Erythrobacter sp. T5W1-R]MEA1619082.1 hypothetical protein [Erythrobacter sp. T5W1-R]
MHNPEIRMVALGKSDVWRHGCESPHQGRQQALKLRNMLGRLSAPSDGPAGSAFSPSLQAAVTADRWALSSVTGITLFCLRLVVARACLNRA